MKNVATIGVDLAKNIFQIHGADKWGNKVLERRVSRRNLLELFVNLKPCLVGLEACGGSHHWAREIEKLGHEVRQMPPQYVKPYVKTNKNDRNDAEAICEAVIRPTMRFVTTKNIEQQDIQAVHRCRERLVKSRTALSNQARALLLEMGLTVPQGFRYLRRLLPEMVEDTESILTLRMRDLLSDMYAEFVDIEVRIKKYDTMLEIICKESEACRRIRKIPGFGPLCATAFVAAVGDAKTFKNGRQLAAWAGLVPRQHSSGNKQWLGSISKRGNKYLRTLLIHGGRSLLRYCQDKTDFRSRWLAALMERRGNARASVAQANKMARMAWSMLAKDEEYQAIA
jgi:transposase